MNVLVLNQHNSDNIGDKLIGSIMRKELSTSGIAVTLGGYAQMTAQSIVETEGGNSLFEWCKQRCPAWLKYLLLYKRKIINEEIRCSLKEQDVIIIGGGQLIKHGGVFPYCFRDWAKIAQRYNIPLIVYGVGVDDNIDKRDKTFYREGLEYATFISCRDWQSSHTINRIITKQVFIWPDVAFSIGKQQRSDARNDFIMMPYSYDAAKLNFSSLNNRKEYYKKLTDLIYKEEYSDLILTATTSVDLVECYLYGDYLSGLGINYKILVLQNADELIKVLSGAKVLCSGRMHALILGCLCELKVIPLIISSKIEDFYNNYLDRKDSSEKAILESREGFELLNSLIEKHGKHHNSSL